MAEFTTYMQFQSIDQADELIDVLNENTIEYTIEDNSRAVSDYIMGQDTTSNILVKINKDDFARLNEIMEKQAQQELENVEKDYYLFTFANEELLSILSEPDAWCELDRKLAKKILNERGIPISDTLEQTFMDKRVKDLSKKEEGSRVWTTVGYILAFLGGIIGIAIGIALWTTKRTLPTGERVYVYTDRDRRHGRVITVIGIVMVIIYIGIRIAAA
jgi:hypothetical protein